MEKVPVNPYAMGFSFVIITDNDEPQKLARLIDSISTQNIPESEVIVVSDKERTGHLGKLRNAGCRAAKYYHLVVLDDDMILHPGWYEGLLRFEKTNINPVIRVYNCVILNLDYTRYWDHKAHENGKNWLLDYGDEDPRVSLTGGVTIFDKGVFKDVQWDESRGFNQEEDVDFTNRLRAAGYQIGFNPWSTITHDGPYTQIGRGVMKL